MCTPHVNTVVPLKVDPLYIVIFIINPVEEENDEEEEKESEEENSASKIPTKEEAYHNLESVVKYIESSSSFCEKDKNIINEIRQRLLDINFNNLFIFKNYSLFCVIIKIR
jgi:hypothetical protein